MDDWENYEQRDAEVEEDWKAGTPILLSLPEFERFMERHPMNKLFLTSKTGDPLHEPIGISYTLRFPKMEIHSDSYQIILHSSIGNIAIDAIDYICIFPIPKPDGQDYGADIEIHCYRCCTLKEHWIIAQCRVSDPDKL
ncbi:MAG: hypothetical protein LIO60_01865 [Oscillospiraceae bacterium]|nr:hypothetical protein [Oscillospiraceae bacterium]